VEAVSLPRAPAAVKAPIHTQHTGQHADDGLAELIPWSWPSGSQGATPLPGWSWGSEPGSGLSAYRTGRGAIQGRIPGRHRGPHQWEATRPEDASVAIQAQPNSETPTPYTHTHTHTIRMTAWDVCYVELIRLTVTHGLQ
jgi:hypothetical protein